MRRKHRDLDKKAFTVETRKIETHLKLLGKLTFSDIISKGIHARFLKLRAFLFGFNSVQAKKNKRE